MRLSGQFFARLQFDDANPERSADNGRQTRSIRIDNATIAPHSRLIVFFHPGLAQLDRFLSRFC